jgi:AcrR family transcriptional regulator
VAAKKAKGKAKERASIRLPAGRHGLPREYIKQNQRERIVTALVDTVAEQGYHETTVADITKAAKVSRRTFYEHFKDKEACFLAAYEMVAEHLAASVRAAAESFDDWPQRVRAAISTLLRFLAGEPELARFCMIEPNAAGGEIAARHRASLQALIEILKSGRPEHSGRPLPEATEETLVGGIISLVVREIQNDRAARLEELLPEVVELTLAPYIGQEESERVARA